MKAFTILIVAAALVVGTFCSDTKAGQQLSKPEDSAAVVRALGIQPGVKLNQCNDDVKKCKKVVLKLQTKAFTHVDGEKKSLYNTCAGLPNLFGLDNKCKGLADHLHSISIGRLSHLFDQEIRCDKSEIDSCK